ncbi:MAG TPA: xanthine dehydrogenase family protein molybdopterin-binding subunit, partial [Gaiellaceae bacterium]|nr:xanthine dehydrogenase family protein molybdopterin-binding subunit [Gaiellaceae bacterium]
MTTTFMGSPVKRKEDASHLQGRGTFVDSLTLPGTVYMAVVRSPFPHARITSVDLEAARSAEGVIAAFSGADLAEDWAGPLPMAWPVTEDTKNPPHYPLTPDVARYQGDGVAVVVAESRALAKDAAELVEVEYEQLSAVANVDKALEDGAPLVHEDLGTNECYVWQLETNDFQAALDAADVVVTRRHVQPRLIPNAIEPRGVIAQAGPTGEVTIWSATQIPHILRFATQLVLGIAESKVRVIAPDVGGGFGSKLDVYAEEMLAVALARRLGRPVKWTEERSENYVATIHGRDVVHELTFAATKDGKITAVKSDAKCAMGAYLQLVTPGIPLLGAWIYSGPYAIPNYSVTFTGVFTNTTPTDAYRGAGRPEATYVLERTMDALAAELGMDPLELRRKNFVSEFPYTMSSGLTIDSGDYHASLDRLLELLDLDAIRADQESRRANGDVKQLGVGFSTYNEMCGLAPSRILGAIRYAVGGWESATIRFQPLGSVQVVTGTSPHGQGHETAWAQIVADRLGVEVGDVEVLHGDTAVSQQGMDSYGSRSLAVGGIALWHAGGKVIDKARKVVAHQLEVAEDDLEFANGTFSVKGSPDRTMGIKEVAFAAHAAHDLPEGMEPGLEETAVFDPPTFSWPGGAHAAVVEVDTETGDARLLRYVAVDD